MNIDTSLKNLLNNPAIIETFKKVNSPDYSKLSFSEKREIFKTYNEVVEEELNTLLSLYINKSKSNNSSKYRTVDLSVFDSKLVIDGLDRNPYYYLRDILLMHLVYLNDENYMMLQIGDVTYNTNYGSGMPLMSMYNHINISSVQKARNFMLSMIADDNNEYIGEFLKDFDNVITKEGKEELQDACDIMDSYASEYILLELKDINDKLEEMYTKESLSKNELAMLSLNEVVFSYFSHLIDKKFRDPKVKNHYGQFVNTFFPEYKDDIQIKLSMKGVFINKRSMDEDEMFLDVLLQTIEEIERNSPRIDNIINDSELNRFNREKREFSKLDIYFYKVMQELDSLLKNRNLELINYMPWTKLYKDESRTQIFNTSTQPFDNLINQKEFLDLIRNIMAVKNKQLNSLFQQVIQMMNDCYGVDFKLHLNDSYTIDSSMGTADNESSIYLNVNNNVDRQALLATFFHEYRHLMQYNEVKHSTGIYNRKLLKIIKTNTYQTSFGVDYNYASGADLGYDNGLFYSMQPIELDAEDFSELMLYTIFSKLGNESEISRMCFADTFTNNVYFDREMISLESYTNFLEINNIKETVQEEEHDYKLLIKRIKDAKDKSDAIAIFKMRNFTALKFKYKFKIYGLIADEKYNLKFDEENSIITISGKKYSTQSMSDYELLEKILILDATNKLKDGSLKFNDYNKYIYDESRIYKLEEYDKHNCSDVYSYHVCFDKYTNTAKRINNFRRRK